MINKPASQFKLVSMNFLTFAPYFHNSPAIKKNLRPLEAKDPKIKIGIDNPKNPDAIVNTL